MENENTAEAKLLALQLQGSTGCTFEQAWNRVRDSRPELFGFVVNRADDEPTLCERAHNRIVREAQSQDHEVSHFERPSGWTIEDEHELQTTRNGVINAFRVKNRCSFQEAWEGAKAERPDLFPIR
jgi:hypothetical protein